MIDLIIPYLEEKKLVVKSNNLYSISKSGIALMDKLWGDWSKPIPNFPHLSALTLIFNVNFFSNNNNTNKETKILTVIDGDVEAENFNTGLLKKKKKINNIININYNDLANDLKQLRDELNQANLDEATRISAKQLLDMAEEESRSTDPSIDYIGKLIERLDKLLSVVASAAELYIKIKEFALRYGINLPI